MRDFNDVQTLLEKYWEGETTLEEERQIKGYFAAGNVDERLRQYAPLFQALKEEQAVQLSKAKTVPIRPQIYQWQGYAAAASVVILLAAGLWWAFSKPVDAPVMANQDKPAIETPVNTAEQVAEPNPKVLASAQSDVSKRTMHPKRVIHKKDKSPELNAEEEAAMAEIKAALALVSSKIRKGRQEAAKGAVHLESVDRIFKKKEG
jgi:hypothetical protein